MNFEDRIREMIREEIRIEDLLATCYRAYASGATLAPEIVEETWECVPRACIYCQDAELFDFSVADENTPPVYFVQSDANLWVKVGYGDPARRLSGMRSGSPVPLRLVGVVPSGGPALEALIHDKLSESRQHGEWFDFSRPLLHLIHQVRREWPDRNFPLPPVLIPKEWTSK